MTNRERLQSEVDNFHQEILGKLGDEAADRGDTKLEAGYRWLAAAGKWPYQNRRYLDRFQHLHQPPYTKEGFYWVDYDGMNVESYEIPKTVYEKVTANDGGPSFHTKSHALEAVARAVGELLSSGG